MHTEPLDTLPVSREHREGEHQYSGALKVLSCPMSATPPSAALEAEGPLNCGDCHILTMCMAFILSRSWPWVQKNRKIIKFYGQHPAPNRNFLVKPLRA